MGLAEAEHASYDVECRTRTRQWVLQACAGSAGGAHRATKVPVGWRPDPTHYGAMAAKAVELTPYQLNVQPEAQDTFEKTFGAKWGEVVKKGLVYNAMGACKKLGITTDELDAKWGGLKLVTNGPTVSERSKGISRNSVGNIVVNNLDKAVDDKALYDTFSLFGNIISCKVPMGKKGGSRGHGFVHFETEEAPNTASQRANGMMIGEKTVKVTMTVKAKTDNPQGEAHLPEHQFGGEVRG